jgi:hypothetical protein
MWQPAREETVSREAGCQKHLGGFLQMPEHAIDHESVKMRLPVYHCAIFNVEQNIVSVFR